jgi:prealbumin domain-containing protein
LRQHSARSGFLGGGDDSMRPRKLRLLAGGLVAGLAVVVLSGVALANGGDKPGDNPGKGKGRTKVVLCHEGRTIRVAEPAVKAHLRHGDTLGPCAANQAPPAPSTTTLTVLKHVVNDNGGTLHAGDFTLTINGVSATGGNSFAGSESGVTKTITTFGGYSVTEATVAGYAETNASADCFGTIAAGQHKTCVITNDDVP